MSVLSYQWPKLLTSELRKVQALARRHALFASVGPTASKPLPHIHAFFEKQSVNMADADQPNGVTNGVDTQQDIVRQFGQIILLH